MSQSDSKDLKQIFDSFDIDKSGSIELQELKSVASALGSQIQDHEMKNIIKNLDINNDGKISFEEFKYWWQNGHKGSLGKLVYLKSKSNKFTKEIVTKLSSNGVNIQQIQSSKTISRLLVQAEMEEASMHQKMSISTQLHHKGSNCKAKIDQLFQKYPHLHQDSFNLLINLPTSNPSQAKIAISSFINSILHNEIFPIKLQDFQNNPFFNIKILDSQNEVVISLQILAGLLELFQQPLSQINKISSLLQNDLFISVFIDIITYFTMDDLLDKNLLEVLSQGFKISGKVDIPESLLLKVRQIMQSTIDEIEQNSIQMIFLMLLKNLSLKLKLRSPEMINKFFQKLGIKQILEQCPNLSQILQQISLFNQIMEIKQNIQDPKHLIYKWLQILNRNQISKFNISLQYLDYYINLNINIPYLKIFNIIFNQI